MCCVSKKKNNNYAARRLETGHCEGQTSIVRGRPLWVFVNKTGGRFQTTPGEMYQKEDGLLNF